MAKEEIPDRMTKSVPLAGGMQDDVPEFLQEFPSLAYVENGRFRKANEVEKTLPETDFSPVSAPFGDSLAVDVAGDTLLAVGVDGAREYTTASGWRTLAGSSTDLTSKSDVASSSQAGGAMHFDWAKSTIGDEFYVIAFETRSTSSAGAGSFNVVIESFTLGGTLIDREIIVNGRGPQVNATADGRVVVHYGLKYIFTNNLYVYDTTAKTSSIVHDYSSNPIDINEETPALIAIRSELSTVTGDTGQGDLPLGKAPPALETYNPIRMGLHPAGQNLWYKVSYRDGTTEDGAILWQDSAVTNHGVRLMKLGSDGQRSSGGSVVTVEASTPVTASTQYFPLDVAVNYDGTEFCIWTLTGYRSSVPNTSSLVAKRYNHAAPAAPTTSEIVATGSFTIVNGTIAGPGFGGANIAYTRILGDEGNLQDTEDGRCAIKWGYLDDGDVWSDWGELPHHRLTSNLIPLSSSSLFACEQFGIFQPYQIPAIGSFGIENPPLPGLKSSTAIFVKAGDDGEVTPAATFDATTSKHTNFSMQEQNMFLGRMRVDSGSVYYCNRQQLQAEDFSGLRMSKKRTGLLVGTLETSGGIYIL